jgi:hypothetical protein
MSAALAAPSLAGTRHAGPVVLAALGIAGAALLAPHLIAVNLSQACIVNDTPYLELCPAPPAAREQRAAQSRSRIFGSPGDARAYVDLAFADASASAPRILQAAARVAPADANVATLSAAKALEREDFPAAVAPLVNLVEYGNNDRAALVLARLIGSGQWQLLAEYVTPGTKWLHSVLAQMPQAERPLSAALPLIVLALDKEIFAPADLMPHVRQMKAAGAWGDAYSLWVALHAGASPTLYNASFDQPFEADGFDWEAGAQQPIGQSGAQVRRARDEQRGPVLEIRFTGRPFSVPLVRQHVFLGPGRYRLRGDYKTGQLRIEQGLAWTVRCTATPQSAQSTSLGDTANQWQRFDFEFAIPANCGWVTSLQLETFAPFEATVGSRGRASFDALSLEKLER